MWVAAYLVLITHSVKHQNTVVSLRCVSVVYAKHTSLLPLHSGEMRSIHQFSDWYFVDTIALQKGLNLIGKRNLLSLCVMGHYGNLLLDLLQ